MAAGWDAAVQIQDPGTDPFAFLTDDELLNAHAGVLAATVEAQVNGRRLLDSAIVPDAELIVRVEGHEARFNEITVSTPKVAPMRYTAADGSPLTSVEPYYPGLAPRAAPSRVRLFQGADETTGDPVATCFANAVALLQIGVETGHDVRDLAEVFNAAWGTPGLFSAATASGIMGTTQFTALAAEAASGDARLLYSWQKCSAIRSGVLPLRATNFGPSVHLDYRRVRVAAENFFQLTKEMEATSATGEWAGQITYAVRPESATSCAPSTFFPDAVGTLPMQARPAYAAAQISAASASGMLAYLWPAGFAEDVPPAYAAGAGGLRLPPTEFSVPKPRGARISAATVLGRMTPLAAAGTSAVRADSRTVPRTLSAMIHQMATGEVAIDAVAWVAKLATIGATGRSLKAGGAGKRELAQYARHASVHLYGRFARALEVGTHETALAAMARAMPRRLRRAQRSQATITRFLVWELVRSGDEEHHTLARTCRKVLAEAREYATAATYLDRSAIPADASAAWVGAYLQPLRAYWRVNYGAAADVLRRLAGGFKRQDMEVAYAVAAAVDTFRAEFMASATIAADARGRAGTIDVRGTIVYFKPYAAAAKLRRTLTPLLAVTIPEFESSSFIEDWLEDVGWEIAPAAAALVASLPRHAPGWAGAGATPLRGLQLAAAPGALAAWAHRAVADVASDFEAVLAKRPKPSPAAQAMAAVAAEDVGPAEQAAAAAVASSASAFGVPQDDLAADQAAVYASAVADIADDVWDDFLMAELDGAAEAAELHAALRAAASPAAASRVTAAITAKFGGHVASEARRIA